MIDSFNEAIYLGLSKEKKLLRVELLSAFTHKDEAWYIVYWENMFDFSNDQRENTIMINENMGIGINSFSAQFDYRIFDSKRDAVEFIYNNEEFKVLR